MPDAQAPGTPVPAESRWPIGPWHWLPQRQRLVRMDPGTQQEQAVAGRAAEVLGVLLAHAGQVVSKDTLLDAIWPDQDVEEGNLPVHISALRKLLGHEAIATIPGRGYRLTLPVPPTGAAAMPPQGQGRAAMDQQAGQPVDHRAGPSGHPAAGPPPQPPDAATPAGNLPGRSPALIGREAELQQLAQALQQAHVVSLVGPAGLGKTALARHLATQVQASGRHADGVWWIEAAELSPGQDLVQRVGQVLGLPLNRAPEPLAALCRGLASMDMLLVLDNCEHLVADAAALVQALEARCLRVRWLVTSQEPLKLPQEQVQRLAPLAVPPPGTPPAQAWASGALALLQARALASDRRCRLQPAHTDRAIELCRRLDGIPLAIEMAAARLPLLGLDGVLQRLDERLRLLVTDQRLGTPRHRSLQAALDWSHGLLNPAEQAVMWRLSVFRGGFTLELAQAVAADGHRVSPWDALEALAGLVDKSLVQLTPEGPAQPRYHLLESTRLYARAQAEAVGEAAASQGRHARALAQWADAAMHALWHQGDQAWLAGRAEERANLQVALDHALAIGDAALATPLFEATVWLGNLLGGGNDNRRFIEPIAALAGSLEVQAAALDDRACALAARAAPVEANGHHRPNRLEDDADADANANADANLDHDHDPACSAARLWGLTGRLWLHLAATLRHHQPGRAAELYARALRPFERMGDRSGRFRALAGSTIALARQSQLPEARAQLQAMRGCADPADPPRLAMFLPEAEGFLSAFEGRREASRTHYQRYIACAMAGGVDGALAVAMANLADIALALGDVAEAIRTGRALVARLRQGRNRHDLGWALGNLTGALVAAGELAEAEHTGREALALMRLEDYAAWLFDPLGLLAALRGRWWQAAWLLGHGDAAREDGRIPREATEAMAYDRALALLRAELGEEALAHALAQGRRLSAAEADALVMGWT